MYAWKNVLQASLLQKCLRQESKYNFFAAALIILLIELQALVYEILPSTTAVFSYAIGSRKLSANEQFFVGAQTVVSLLQTTQIISDVCFITDHVAYASSNKTKIVWIETELFFFFFFFTGGGCVHVYVRAWALSCFHSLISTRTFRRALTASVDSCAEIKSAPSVAKLNLAEFGGRCRSVTVNMSLPLI